MRDFENYIISEPYDPARQGRVFSNRDWADFYSANQSIGLAATLLVIWSKSPKYPAWGTRNVDEREA